LGATAGRTTLSGEGLQHQDGSSHVVAATVPNCRAWDPGLGYELAAIVAHGVKRMGQEQRDEFHYITVMNENVAQPARPAAVSEADIVSGLYKLTGTLLPEASEPPRLRLLGSGMILQEVIAAARLLEEKFGIVAEVWSVTSFAELAREAREAQRRARFAPGATSAESGDPARAQRSRVATCLAGNMPVVAATDYVRAVPQLVAEYVGAPYTTLGTDGFGRSATRRDLRRFFEVDRQHIALAALAALADIGAWPRDKLAPAMQRLGIVPELTPPWLA
jgi:pyruvate dehydrogenase E1 component